MCGHHHRSAAQSSAAPRPTRTTRPPADDVRASDAEREQVVSELREHGAAGRLGVEELDQRVEAALSATTRRDLAGLLGDLPAIAPPRRPRSDGCGEHLRSYLMVMALLVAIWALTGAGYFWPVWPMLGWGIGVLSHASATRGGRARRRHGPPALHA